jgi:hypothetical protein
VGSRVGLHAPHDRANQEPRREVLSSALLAFAGRLLQESLERLSLDIDIEHGPFGLVDQPDHPLEIHRVGEAGLRPSEDVAK